MDAAQGGACDGRRTHGDVCIEWVVHGTNIIGCHQQHHITAQHYPPAAPTFPCPFSKPRLMDRVEAALPTDAVHERPLALVAQEVQPIGAPSDGDSHGFHVLPVALICTCTCWCTSRRGKTTASAWASSKWKPSANEGRLQPTKTPPVALSEQNAHGYPPTAFGSPPNGAVHNPCPKAEKNPDPYRQPLLPTRPRNPPNCMVLALPHTPHDGSPPLRCWCALAGGDNPIVQ